MAASSVWSGQPNQRLKRDPLGGCPPSGALPLDIHLKRPGSLKQGANDPSERSPAYAFPHPATCSRSYGHTP